MNRLLLSTNVESDVCPDDPYESLTQEVSHHDANEAFMHVYYVMLFVASLWFVGRAVTKLGMPSLVGEIVFGMIMGPNFLNLVGTHGSEFLIVIGEIGLIMLVVEAGIDVDIGMLKLIGPRGLAIACLGSVIPLSMGLALSLLVFKQTFQSAIAIGACFAPTSMGIALNVLKKAKILNTPTGQLIIAAAILDDVIALIILSELSAMKDPSVQKILLPLIVSPILILVVGYLAITYIPKLIKKIMSVIPEKHHENSILALLFVSTFILIPACNFVGSSYLLGAFLSGLMFCTDHTIHHVWTHQIKRVLYWMLRIFFACTIGFAIPIQEFTSMKVIVQGLVYCICMLGKIITGVFARPLNKKEFFTVGFSMSAWGEFAFILATASYAEGTFDKESFSAVLLAVLLSVIVSPYALAFTIKFYEKQIQKQMDKTLSKFENEFLHPVYFAINTKARGQWGHQDKILHEIFELSLEIIDFRSWHAPEYNHSHHRPLTKESFYVMDNQLLLPPTKHLSKLEKQQLKNKVKQIRTALKLVLGEEAVISCKRWLPGVLERDDTMDVGSGGADHAMLLRKLSTRRTSYCRREAFKQAHAIMSMSSMDLTQIMEDHPEKIAVQSNSNLREPNYKAWLNTFGQTVPGKKTISQTQSVQTVPKKIPTLTPLTRTQSDATASHRVFRPSMMRQSSAVDYHTGMGHGGKAKGVGALPVSNDIINIHDYFEQRKRKNMDQAMAELEVDSDDSVSVIYGDEDAQHHKLPEYQKVIQPGGALVMSQSPTQELYYYGDSPIVENLNGIKTRKATFSNHSVATGSYPDIRENQIATTPVPSDIAIAIAVDNIGMPYMGTSVTASPGITPAPDSPDSPAN